MIMSVIIIIVRMKDAENIPVTWSCVSSAIIAAPEESSVRFPS